MFRDKRNNFLHQETKPKTHQETQTQTDTMNRTPQWRKQLSKQKSTIKWRHKLCNVKNQDFFTTI